VVAVALRRGHERLDAPELDALLGVEDRAEQRLLGFHRLPHGLRIADIEAGEAILDALHVELERGQEVLQKRAEVRARPPLGELESMGDLVQRDPRSKVPLRQAPIALERGDVRNDEQQRSDPLAGDGDVVLTEDALAEVSEDLPDLRSEQQRRQLGHRLLQLRGHGAHPTSAVRFLGEGVIRSGVAAGAGDRGAYPRGRWLDDAAQPLDVRLDPLRAPDGSDGGDVTRRLETRELADLELREPGRLLEEPPVLIVRSLVGARPRGRGDADLPRELPVHRAGRRQQHPLNLAEERDVGEDVALWEVPRTLGRSGVRHRAARFDSLIRPSYDPL
jgi:hypothetical protein